MFDNKLAQRTLLAQPFGGTVAPPGVAAARQSMGEFASFGDYIGAVMRTTLKPGAKDDRLLFEASTPTTSGSEHRGGGIDGGYLVPPQFVAEVARKLFGQESLLMRCDVRTTQTGALMIPKDESAPWPSNTGVQVAWEDELVNIGTAIPSKAALNGALMRCKKLAAFLPVTDELITDGNALAEHISAVAPEKMLFAAERAILLGSGAGQPLGVVGAPGTIVQAKEGAQSAGTIVTANIEKMWTALTPAARRNATWVVHPDADLQLAAIPYPLYQPASDSAPFGRLMGRPIYTSEACSQLGTVGDIVVGNFSAYLAAVTTLRYAASVHLFFDIDIQALRFVFRIDGQPWTSKTIPSLNGGASRGFFVTLAAR